MASIDEKNQLVDKLSSLFLLAKQVITESSKLKCVKVAEQVNQFAEILHHLARSTSRIQSLYERPIRKVAAEVSKYLESALTLVGKCKHKSFIYRVVFTITSAAEFRKLSTLLDVSIGDLKWILKFYETENSGFIGGGFFGPPPLATIDPILSRVWFYITYFYLGELKSCIEAANGLASLANENDCNKKMIVEEGGVPPLLKLFKENSSPDVQIAAAIALYNLANDEVRVRCIVNEGGVGIIIHVLSDSPIRVQIEAAKLVARMVERDSVVAQEDFGRENVIKPLVTLMSFKTFDDDPLFHLGKQRQRENERPEVKIQLKVNCAEALWKFARQSISNCWRIVETKGLLCLAKIVEKEMGELQYNCLMTIMEITAVAESNAGLRCKAFKTKSPAAKALVDQLLRVIKELNSSMLLVPAIKSIGSLANTFPAKEKRVLEALVTQLDNKDEEVAVEAAIALQKFTWQENAVCVDHSKAIIEFNSVLILMSLLRRSEEMQLHALILLCHLAINDGKNKALEQARVYMVAQMSKKKKKRKTVVAQHPELGELLSKAINQLILYHPGDVPSKAVV